MARATIDSNVIIAARLPREDHERGRALLESISRGERLEHSRTTLCVWHQHICGHTV